MFAEAGVNHGESSNLNGLTVVCAYYIENIK